MKTKKLLPKKEAYELIKKGKAIFYRMNYLLWERVAKDRINVYCYDQTFDGYKLILENAEESPESLDFWFTEARGQI